MSEFNASSTRRISVTAMIVLITLTCEPQILPQVISGTLAGTVVDPSGAAIADASITLLNEGTKTVREDKSDQAGRFVFTAVQPGAYTIRIAASGFRTVERTGNVLLANSTLQLGPISLTVGETKESITVSAQTSLVQS